MNFVTVKNETELDGLLTKQDSLRSQMDSDLESETIRSLLSLSFLAKKIDTVASVSIMKFVRTSPCTVMCCKGESRHERNHAGILKCEF